MNGREINSNTVKENRKLMKDNNNVIGYRKNQNTRFMENGKFSSISSTGKTTVNNSLKSYEKNLDKVEEKKIMKPIGDKIISGNPSKRSNNHNFYGHKRFNRDNNNTKCIQPMPKERSNKYNEIDMTTKKNDISNDYNYNKQQNFENKNNKNQHAYYKKNNNEILFEKSLRNYEKNNKVLNEKKKYKNYLKKKKPVEKKKIERGGEKKKFNNLCVENFNININNTGKNKFIDLNVNTFNLFFEKIAKMKLFNKLEKKLSEEFSLEKIEQKSKKNMPTNDKIKDILLIFEQCDLSEDELKTIIDKLSKKISQSNQPIGNKENKKYKKNKSNENEQKNTYDYKSNLLNNEDLLVLEKEESRYQKFYGFINYGNNCYLNSSLQLLTRIKDLKDEVMNLNEYYTENDTKGRLIIEFRNMLQEIENLKVDNYSLNPIKLKKIMGNIDNKYNLDGQEDSNEFISNFLNALLSETGNKEKKIKSLNIVDEKEKRAYGNLCKKFYQRKGDSFILNLFYGILKVKKMCVNCGEIYSIKFNVYNMLDFPLCNLEIKNRNKDFTLDDLLKKFTEKKKCDDICNNCKSDKIYSETIIYTLPRYLLIHFERVFDSKYYSNNIEYSKYLNIKTDFEKKEFSYILDCVIEHSGGIYGGHYTSLIPIDRKNNSWVRYSDEYCNRFNIGFESRNANILLYKLISK